MPKLPGDIICETDGFRDIATLNSGAGRMNPETIALLTSNLIDYQLEAGATGPVVVAQDTRSSGQALRYGAIAAASQRGTEVVDGGILPTPAAQKIASEVGAIATVVISASHNPAQYNGWKGMLGNRKPNSAEIAELSRRYWKQVQEGVSIPTDRPGNVAFEQASWRDWYTQEVVKDIENEFGSQPLSGKLFVIDGAHGAASNITPNVFKQLGARVKTFCCDPGEINKDCGAANLDGLKTFLETDNKTILDPDFVGALANDGDADRVMGLGLNNRLEIVEINGNHIMAAQATSPTQPGIVGTVYTNSGLRQRLDHHGIEFDECKNGDSYVTQGLLSRQAQGDNWTRGGEFTGHLIDTKWLSSGDGVHMAAWFAAYAVKEGKTFGNLYDDMPLWHEKMVARDLPAGIRIDPEHSKRIQSAKEVAEKLGARAIIRKSGTEPKIRIWNESPNKKLTELTGRLLLLSVMVEMDKA